MKDKEKQNWGIIISTLSIFLISSSQGAILSYYDFEAGTLSATSVDSGFNSGDVSDGTGAPDGGTNFAYSNAGMMNGNYGLTTGVTFDDTYTTYYNSTFTTGRANSTSTVTYENITFDTWAHNTSWDISVSYTDGGSNSGTLNFSMVAGDVETITFDFADFTTTSDVDWTFSALMTSGTVNAGRFDDITLNGTVNLDAVPEPSSLALFSLGTFALIARRSRFLS